MKIKAFLNKAKTTAIVVLLLFIFILVLCLRLTSFFDIVTLNKNSTLDVPLCASYEEIPDGYKEYNDDFFGFSMYRNDNKGAEVKTSSFPDASIGKSKITGICLKETNTDANILGIKIGDDDSIAYKQLEKYKFKIVKSSNDTIVAKKHRLRINVSIGDNYEIKEISVTVDTTNVLRVQY